MRFDKKGNLSLRFIIPYEVLDKVGKVAYPLALQNDHQKVHDVFYIFQLKKYVLDSSHVLDPNY